MAEADVAPGYGGWHLEPNWQGLEAERDGVTYNAEKLKKIAEELEGKLKILEGMKAGSLSHLMANTDLSDQRALAQGIARWNGGHAFFDTLKDGNREFSEIYADVAARLKVVTSLVYAGAGIYEGAGLTNLGKG